MNQALSTLAVSAMVASCSLGEARTLQPNRAAAPDHSQQEAEELVGKQRQMMEDLSSTPAEQAATAHGSQTAPVESLKYTRRD